MSFDLRKIGKEWDALVVSYRCEFYPLEETLKVIPSGRA
jgi:hypothetical protein